MRHSDVRSCHAIAHSGCRFHVQAHYHNFYCHRAARMSTLTVVQHVQALCAAAAAPPLFKRPATKQPPTLIRQPDFALSGHLLSSTGRTPATDGRQESAGGPQQQVSANRSRTRPRDICRASPNACRYLLSNAPVITPSL